MYSHSSYAPSVDPSAVLNETCAIAAVKNVIALVYRIEKEGDYFIATAVELPIFGCGETELQAAKDLIANLELAWDGLKNRRDFELSGDALVLREKLAPYFDDHCDAESS